MSPSVLPKWRTTSHHAIAVFHPAPVDPTYYFPSVTSRNLHTTKHFATTDVVFPHRSFLKNFCEIFFLGFLRLRRVTGVNDQLTNRESCLFLFCGAARRRKEFSLILANFRAVNAEEPEHGEVVEQIERVLTRLSPTQGHADRSSLFLEFSKETFYWTQIITRKGKETFSPLKVREKIHPENQINPTASSMGILQGDSPTPGPAMYWVSDFNSLSFKRQTAIMCLSFPI